VITEKLNPEVLADARLAARRFLRTEPETFWQMMQDATSEEAAVALVGALADAEVRARLTATEVTIATAEGERTTLLAVQAERAAPALKGEELVERGG
jgi:hypothetical protein